MDNEYTGEVTIELKDKERKLVYDYRALSQIRSEHGDNIFNELFTLDPMVLASLLSIGLSTSDEIVTVENVLEASPPIHYVANAIDRAVTIAYFGADGLKEIEKEAAKLNKQADGDKAAKSKKKTVSKKRSNKRS